MLCLFPQLKCIPYEFWKATGPGNCVVVPVSISDSRKKPRRGRPFHSFFSADLLKEMIGRRGKLYIRPVESIQSELCPYLTETEVSTPVFIQVYMNIILLCT